MRIVSRPSPNQSPRIHGDKAVRLIVCHTPEGGYAGTVAFILTPKAQVSYHLLIKKDGTEATQFVDWRRKAWHAGPVNSLSDGVSIEGHARHFDLDDEGVLMMAIVVAQRLIARGLKPQWTTDPGKGGFCRHGDLQDNRTDPTPDLAEWRLFIGMVQAAYQRLKKEDKTWPIPLPAWTWAWMRWRLTGRKGPRPPDAPKVIPAWAWRRLIALQKAQKQ